MAHSRENGSELPSGYLEEVIRLSDRILVLCGGKTMGIVSAETATREQLGLMMAGVTQPHLPEAGAGPGVKS